MSAFLIAEAGVNHNGNIDLALRLVDAAADAGADAVKFQTFRADAIATDAAPMAEYQRRTSSSRDGQRDMLRRLELDEAAHLRLMAHCATRSVAFLSTPFDMPSLDLLIGTLDLATIKIGSGDLTNAPLLHAATRAGRKIILSTGMATMDEVRTALGVLAHGYTRDDAPSFDAFEQAFHSGPGQAALRNHVTLLHCTTEYPAPFLETNLRAMDTLRDAFALPTGLSDHTPGIAVAIGAAARGAAVIEKHVTLDRDLPGPDHAASLEPGELALLVRSVREVEDAIGDGDKRPMPSEIKNKVVARKGLVAARAIRRGETIDATALAVKRPEAGASPLAYWDWLGRIADRDYSADEPIGG